MRVRKAASPRSISSQASASETKSRPAPPYCSGTTMPSRPSSAMPSITPRSRRWLTSFSIAFGSTRSSTNARTVSWISRCSGVSSKSTGMSLVRCPLSAGRLVLQTVCSNKKGVRCASTRWRSSPQVRWPLSLYRRSLGSALPSSRRRRSRAPARSSTARMPRTRPEEFIQGGKIVGSDIDFGTEIAKLMGVKAEFKNTTLRRHHPGPADQEVRRRHQRHERHARAAEASRLRRLPQGRPVAAGEER